MTTQLQLVADLLMLYVHKAFTTELDLVLYQTSEGGRIHLKLVKREGNNVLNLVLSQQVRVAWFTSS